jgi:hypothetical protein
MTTIIDGTAGITFPNSTTQLVAGAPLTTPSFTTTIGVGAATASASGAGVTFPATQSASSDANTLDDYEKGTFTPTVRFGGNSVGITYSVRQGAYTKIGNLVYISMSIVLTSKGSSTGSISIGALPFTCNYSLNNNIYDLTASMFDITGGPSAVFGGVNTNYVYIYSTLSTGFTNTSDSVIKNTTEFQIGGCYLT